MIGLWRAAWAAGLAAALAGADDFPLPEAALAKPAPKQDGGPSALNRLDELLKPKPPAAETKTPPGKTEPGLHRVTREPLRQETSLDGVFEAAAMAEILLDPEAWTEFKVLEAAEHGAAVRKGDPLLVFEAKKLDDEIADALAAVALADAEAKEAAEELKAFEATHPLDQQAAARAHELAEAAWQRYQTRDKAMSLKGQEMMLRSAEYFAESAAEELKQLSKMYRQEDLREDTEEIVLKRAKFGAEQAKFSLEGAKHRHEDFLKEELPTRELSQKEALERGRTALAKAKAAAPAAVAQKRLKHERVLRDGGKGAERLRKLQADRKLLAVPAPIDGIVYYGRCDKGKWNPPAAGAADRFRKGTMLRPGEAWMTVVQPRPLFVRASVPEKDARALRTGLAGRAAPAVDPELRLPVRVETVAAAPLAGAFDARIAITAPDDAAGLLPGMTCKLVFVTFQKEALAAPAKAVHTDERDDGKRYVWLRGPEGKPERREVVVGRRVDEKYELSSGLKEGDAIYLEKPPAP